MHASFEPCCNAVPRRLVRREDDSRTLDYIWSNFRKLGNYAEEVSRQENSGHTQKQSHICRDGRELECAEPLPKNGRVRALGHPKEPRLRET